MKEDKRKIEDDRRKQEKKEGEKELERHKEATWKKREMQKWL